MAHVRPRHDAHQAVRARAREAGIDPIALLEVSGPDNWVIVRAIRADDPTKTPIEGVREECYRPIIGEV